MNDSYLTFSTNCDKLLVYVFPLQQFPLSLSPFALLSNATLASGMTSIDYAWENMQNAECIYDAHLWTMTITTTAICNGYDSDTYMHAYIHTYTYTIPCNAIPMICIQLNMNFLLGQNYYSSTEICFTIKASCLDGRQAHRIDRWE